MRLQTCRRSASLDGDALRHGVRLQSRPAGARQSSIFRARTRWADRNGSSSHRHSRELHDFGGSGRAEVSELRSVGIVAHLARRQRRRSGGGRIDTVGVKPPKFLRVYAASWPVVIDSRNNLRGFAPGRDPTTPAAAPENSLLTDGAGVGGGGGSRTESRGKTSRFFGRFDHIMTDSDRF